MSGIESGAATTEVARPPLANLRDLGGLRVEAGSVRQGVLFRADDVSMSSSDELADLYSCGIRLVLDLRSSPERERSPGAYTAAALQSHHLPLLDSDADPVAMASMLGDIATPEDMGQWYATIAAQSATSIVRGLQIIASRSEATVFHCAAGKDRTGIFAAAVLSVLGADDDVIVKDYARTGQFIEAVFARLAPNADTDHQQALETIDVDHPLLGAPAASMHAMLEHLDQTHSGFTALLHDAGLDNSLVYSLRNQLTTD